MTFNEASGTHFQRSAKASLLCPTWRQVNKSCTEKLRNVETTSLKSFGLVKTVGSMFAAPKNSKTYHQKSYKNSIFSYIFKETTCKLQSCAWLPSLGPISGVLPGGKHGRFTANRQWRSTIEAAVLWLEAAHISGDFFAMEHLSEVPHMPGEVQCTKVGNSQHLTGVQLPYPVLSCPRLQDNNTFKKGFKIVVHRTSCMKASPKVATSVKASHLEIWVKQESHSNHVMSFVLSSLSHSVPSSLLPFLRKAGREA